MEDTALLKVFRRLSQGSKQSVQSGKELDAFDKYMHVDRPIDKVVRDAMNDIQQEGGGILFLVGSAGDGKSHMISTLNKEYPDFMFKNDASESPWPTVDSIDALKIFLADFKDAVVKAAESYEPFMISRQIALIARNFNRFYNNSRILNCDSDDLRDARLKLCEAVADCIKSGLDMLGIGVVEKM